MPPIRVSCSDADTADWLGTWFQALQLDPPAELTVRVAVVPELPADADDRTPFLQPKVEIRSGPPLNDLRIRWIGGDASAVISGRTADVSLTPAALSRRERLAETFLVAVLVFLLRRAGWHHAHATGARDPRGRDWLFAGDAEAGKSTTAALLATHGWGVGADDLTFLESGDGVEAIAPHIPIALREGGYALLALTGGTPSRGGRKRAFFPEELGGRFEGRIRPQILILPRVSGDLTHIEPLRAREALAELVRWSAWVALEPDLAQAHLDLLGALARQAKCFRLALGPDLFAGRDILMELVP